MLKISAIESRSERRLEGNLLAAQVTELRIASEKGQSGRSNLVIDLKNLMAISQEGEGVLLGLMTLSFSPKNWTPTKL